MSSQHITFLLLTAVTTHICADVQSLANPVCRDTANKNSKSIDIPGSRAAIGVNVACEARLVMRIADEEDTLDCVEVGARDLGHGIDSCSSALGVPFENETSVGVGLQTSGDLVDDL